MELRSLLACVALALTVGACGAGAGTVGEPEAFDCDFVAGQVTSSAGSSAGQSNISMRFDVRRQIHFNNMNLTVQGKTSTTDDILPSVTSACEIRFHGEIADLGPVCLGSVGAWPGGTSVPVTVFVGHTYLVQFSATCMPGVPPVVDSYVAFTVEAYSNGVLTYTWVEV